MRRRRLSRTFAGLSLCCWFGLSLSLASAHDFLTGYIQHRAEVMVGSTNIDVTLQLTFFEDSSEHERKHMDKDGDGLVSRKEADAYLQELNPTLLEQKVALLVSGRPVPLMTLYPPELDLLGNNGVKREHHVLRLYFFARTPPELASGAELRFRESLWPKFPAIGSAHAMGKDGCQLESRTAELNPISPEAKRQVSFAFRITKPPISSLKGP